MDDKLLFALLVVFFPIVLLWVMAGLTWSNTMADPQKVNSLIINKSGCLLSIAGLAIGYLIADYMWDHPDFFYTRFADYMVETVQMYFEDPSVPILELVFRG